ncbi:MAG: hypothetical protein V1895_02905 [Parcubacteria group bacterium]
MDKRSTGNELETCPTCESGGVIIDLSAVDEVMCSRRARLSDIPRSGYARICPCCNGTGESELNCHWGCKGWFCEYKEELKRQRKEARIEALLRDYIDYDDIPEEDPDLPPDYYDGYYDALYEDPGLPW